MSRLHLILLNTAKIKKYKFQQTDVWKKDGRTEINDSSDWCTEQYTCNLKITELVFTEPKKEFAS